MADNKVPHGTRRIRCTRTLRCLTSAVTWQLESEMFTNAQQSVVAEGLSGWRFMTSGIQQASGFWFAMSIYNLDGNVDGLI